MGQGLNLDPVGSESGSQTWSEFVTEYSFGCGAEFRLKWVDLKVNLDLNIVLDWVFDWSGCRFRSVFKSEFGSEHIFGSFGGSGSGSRFELGFGSE